MLAHPAAYAPLPSPPSLDLRLEHCIDRLLSAARTSPSAAIAVAGPDAGFAMSQLWRRGFDHVEAARCVTCRCADQLSDVLLVLGCQGADQTSAVISAVNPILRDGGVLAIDASRLAGADERLRLCRMLSHRGFRYREGAERKAEIIARKPEAQDRFLAPA